ncbi:MAG: putative metal-binding motif-containing protein [Candidatus Woesearchaeota archaeon]
MRRIILYSFLFLLSLSIAQAACTADTYQNIDCGSFPTYKLYTSNCVVPNTACWIKSYNASTRSDNILPMSACSNTCDTANGYIKVGCQVGNSNACYSVQDRAYYYTIKPICKKRGSYEKCGNGIDDDCDSQIDEGCSGWIGIQSCAADTEWHMEWTQTQSTGQFSSMYEINQYVLKCGATLIENYQNWGSSYVMPSSQTVPSLGTYLGTYPYYTNAQFPQSWDVPFDQSKCKKFKVNFRANYDSAGYDALHPGDWPIGEYYLARNLINNPTRHNFTLAEYNNPDGRVCVTACGNKLYLEINTINDYISSIYDIVGDYSSHTGGSLWDLYCLRCDDNKWLSNGQGDVPLINGVTPGRCCEGTATFNNPGAGNSCCYNGNVYTNGQIDPANMVCRDGVRIACPDNDGDGYGNPGQLNCIGGTQTDCNDANPNISPAKTEICWNGIDEDCDTLIDENCETAQEGSCIFRNGNCQTGENDIFHISSINNAHIELNTQSNFGIKLCCINITSSTVSGEVNVIGITSATNAHAEYGTTMPTRIYLSSVNPNTNLSCDMKSSCAPEETCLAALSEPENNAHVGTCTGGLPNKICCEEISQPLPPPPVCTTIGESCIANINYSGEIFNCPGTYDSSCNCMDIFNDECPEPAPNCLNQPCVLGNNCTGIMDALCNCYDLANDGCPILPDDINCGNGHREPDMGEECDRNDMGFTKCSDYTLKPFGTINCNHDCEYFGCYAECNPSINDIKCANLCGNTNLRWTPNNGASCYKDSNCMTSCGEITNVTINADNVITQKKIALYNGKPVTVNIYSWN